MCFCATCLELAAQARPPSHASLSLSLSISLPMCAAGEGSGIAVSAFVCVYVRRWRACTLFSCLLVAAAHSLSDTRPTRFFPPPNFLPPLSPPPFPSRFLPLRSCACFCWVAPPAKQKKTYTKKSKKQQDNARKRKESPPKLTPVSCMSTYARLMKAKQERANHGKHNTHEPNDAPCRASLYLSLPLIPLPPLSHPNLIVGRRK